MSETQSYDVIVVGGGPAGSTVATLVAQAGHRVLQLEKETFPRFKVGESLIPATYDTLDRLGMLDKMRASNFPKKHSVQFFLQDGRAGAPFYFHETDPSERSQTWQVLRSTFDQMLFENGREKGVETREGIAVTDVLFEAERAVGVRMRGADGQSQEIKAKVVVDATGQRAMLARKLGLRQQDPRLRLAAIFSHFKGGARDPGIDEGATLILHTEGQNSWVWYIPMPGDMVSVGVVGPIERLIRGRGGKPQATFEQELARCPGLGQRLSEARQAMPVQVLNDFSYVSEKVAGDGWVLVGDAFGFLDPMYSSGVLLALASGELAADEINQALADGDTRGERLGSFQPRLLAGMAAFRQLVYAFYDKNFSFGRFLRAHPEHRPAIIDILVGDVFDADFTPLFADLERDLAAAQEASTETSTKGKEGVKA